MARPTWAPGRLQKPVAHLFLLLLPFVFRATRSLASSYFSHEVSIVPCRRPDENTAAPVVASGFDEKAEHIAKQIAPLIFLCQLDRVERVADDILSSGSAFFVYVVEIGGLVR